MKSIEFVKYKFRDGWILYRFCCPYVYVLRETEWRVETRTGTPSTRASRKTATCKSNMSPIIRVRTCLLPTRRCWEFYGRRSSACIVSRPRVQVLTTRRCIYVIIETFIRHFYATLRRVGIILFLRRGKRGFEEDANKERTRDSTTAYYILCTFIHTIKHKLLYIIKRRGL